MNPLIMLIIVFFVLIVVLAVVMRFVKKIVRTAIIVGLIILVVAASGYVLKDANELRKNFLPKDKLLMLELDGRIAAAVVSAGVSVPVPVLSIENLNQMYSAHEYDQMVGDEYKLLIFGWNAFRNIDFVGENEYKFSMAQVREIMSADNPKRLLVDKMAREQGEQFRESISFKINDMFPTNDHLKSVIFSFMLAEFGKKESVFIEYSNGNIFIYPETITLKLAKMLPQKWMQGFLP